MKQAASVPQKGVQKSVEAKEAAKKYIRQKSAEKACCHTCFFSPDKAKRCSYNQKKVRGDSCQSQ